ncbi:hypothetical protein TNCV_324761 [Trichonephila clavipes]|nr:hypothetical protein TNCV_324761 [Trichonephila clavipes]
MSCWNCQYGDKLPDLDAFNRGQIVGVHSISDIVRQLRFSSSTVSRVIPRTHRWWTKTSDRANCKGQLALTVRSEKMPVK